MRALVFALAATLVAMLATTDARPVAAEVHEVPADEPPLVG